MTLKQIYFFTLLESSYIYNMIIKWLFLLLPRIAKSAGSNLTNGTIAYVILVTKKEMVLMSSQMIQKYLFLCRLT